MIRNVVIHVSNEQPLLADLFDMPSPADVGLVCTNIRTTDGKRPVFIDATGSTFFFPYLHIRFIEIPVGALEGRRVPGADDGAGETRLPVPVPAAEELPEPEGELELDEDFLQRIRDI